jgi:hypothetical protein
MRVNKRVDRIPETNLMVLFNNETMILGPTSQTWSKNTSKMEAESPRKIGNTSARNNNYSISTRKTPEKCLKQKREIIDPIDLVDALNEKSVDAIEKN